MRHAGYGPVTRTKFNLPSVHISVIFTLITGIPSSSPTGPKCFLAPLGALSLAWFASMPGR